MPAHTLCGRAGKVITGDTSGLACVVIGRNEGERLVRCLGSVRRQITRMVYVDSGSTDDSVAHAKAIGALVVALDMRVPFTAARARNEGFDAITARFPDTTCVLFVDGDCELEDGFVRAAQAVLDAERDVAVVCGRRAERFPEASLYNGMCDIEWDTPIGDADACGGDALMRASAFVDVGGFDPTVVAGEEPELCVRLRARGHRVRRIDHAMTRHDAAITDFAQWWTRATRAGHAFAQGAAMHGAPPARLFVRETRRAVFFGLALPAVAISAAPITLGGSLLFFAGYPVSCMRAYRAVRARGRAPREAATYAAFTTLGKFAEAKGVLTFHARRIRGTAPTLIEYKRPAPARESRLRG